MWRRGNWRAGLSQRFGKYDSKLKQALTNRNVIWLHAVSVGEMNICVQLIRGLEPRLPNMKFVVSTTTTTGMGELQKRLPLHVSKIYYPNDYRRWVARAFSAIHPNAIVLIESEIWPNFIWRASAGGIPLFLVNARLSDRSYPRYKKLGFLFRPLFGAFTAVGAQNEADALRLRELGCEAAAVKVAGNLKFDAAKISGGSGLNVRALLAQLGVPSEAQLLVAGSTHAGEESILAGQFLRLRDRFPKLFLILVPRHFERAPEIARDLEKSGLTFFQRSQIRPETRRPPNSTQCLLVDTTGELRYFYAEAEVVFVGKSLTAKGGQNPIEPAALGKPVVFGPNMQNFPDVTPDFSAGRRRGAGSGCRRFGKDPGPIIGRCAAARAAWKKRATACLGKSRGGEAHRPDDRGAAGKQGLFHRPGKIRLAGCSSHPFPVWVLNYSVNSIDPLRLFYIIFQIFDLRRAQSTSQNMKKIRLNDFAWAILKTFLGLLVMANILPYKSQGQSCVSPPSGLVSWWKGESNAVDSLGTNNGTLFGGVTYTNGEVGQGFYFSAKQEVVTVGNPTSLQLQNFTIEAWIQIGNPNLIVSGGTQTYGEIFGYGDQGYMLGLSTGGYLFLTMVDDSGVFATQAITDQAFHHVAVTKNGNNVVFYIDGAPEATQSYSASFNFKTSAAIGARADDLTSTFEGIIDEVSIYNVALSPAQIQGIYNAGAAGKCVASPSVTVQPASETVTAGNTALFTSAASGFIPSAYQWLFNSNNINGATNASLVLSNPQTTNGGYYSLIAYSQGVPITSSNSLLMVNPAVCAAYPLGIVGSWPGNGNTADIIGGNNGTAYGNVTYPAGKVGAAFGFTGTNCYVQLNNSTNLQLQNFTIEAWIQIGNTNLIVSGGTQTYGEIFGYGSQGYALELSTGGYLFLTMVGDSGIFATQAISDTAFHHVAVTKNGNNVVFYLDGVAGPVQSYSASFAFGTTPAIGARTDNSSNDFNGLIDEVSFYNRALTPLEIQEIYNASIAGKCSGPTPVLINAQPTNQSLVAGGSASFSVIPAGTPPFSYVWTFKGAVITGATNYTLTLTNSQPINAGPYQVTITNAYGSVTSTVANLIIVGPPVILSQAGAQTIMRGGSALFYVDAAGNEPFYYQWQLNATNLSASNDYTLLVTNAQAANAGSYTVVVSNSFGSVTSAPAILTVLVPPVITNQPQSQTNYLGGNASFAVGAMTYGSAPLFYLWRFNGTNIPNATAATLEVTNLSAGSAGSYSVMVSNIYGATLSSNALLTVVTNPSCFAPPSGLVGWWQGEKSTRDVVSGSYGAVLGNVTYVPGKVGQAFDFNASGEAVSLGNSTNYQLQNFTIEGWIQIGKTNLLTGGNNTYGEIFSYGSQGYGLGLSTSGYLFLTKVDVSGVYAATPLTDNAFHHVAVTKNGTNVIFYIDGAASPSQPYATTFNFSTSLAIADRLDIPSLTFQGLIDEISLYNRALSATEVQSIYAATTLGKCAVPLSLQSQSTNQVLLPGTNASLSVMVAGTGQLTYQWYQNGALIAGATNATLNFSRLNYFQAGNYSVIVSNSSGEITVSNIILSVQPPPLLVNGSFETGNFSGWVTNDLSIPLYPLTVRPAGFNPEFGFFICAPSDGLYCATHGFEGNGPGKISIAQDVYLPSGPALLTFDYRAAWDMFDYGGSTQPRTFNVSIQPFGGGASLHTFNILTAAPQTDNPDTGPSSGSLDLTAYSGQGIRISFEANVPENFTGPGFFELDHVALQYSYLPPLVATKTGSNITLSWPFSATNYTLQVKTNITVAGGWSAISSNLISHGATNNSVTLPAAASQMFYRLSYP